MKRVYRLQRVLIALGCVGLLLPPSILTAAGLPVRSNSTARQTAGEVTDVALQPGGVLHGQVVRPDGSTLGEIPLDVLQSDRKVASAVTNARGEFAISGLRGGVYHLRVGNTLTIFRAWATNTAPPTARPGLLLVLDQTVIRGQLGSTLLPVAILGGVVATAIALPLALKKDKKPTS